MNSEYRRKESCGPPTTFWRAVKIRSRLWVMSESQKYERCPLDFHARFDSKGKTYRYIIRNCPDVDVFKRRYCYQVQKPLDTDKMRQAAGFIVGTHDFKCFQAAGGNERLTTVRTIHRLDIHRQEENVIIEVTGDGFLYNMVRIITGTLVEVGLGKKQPGDIAGIIEKGDRQNAGHTAPAEGLYLVRVYYENF